MSFNLGAPLPQELAEQTRRYLELERLAKLFETEQKRYREAVREACGGQAVKGEGWEVAFSDCVETDWKSVCKNHLEGVDLSPYRSTSSVMYIRRASGGQTE
jgi:hypothetical protein